jgi:hypothetical protein
MAPLGQAGRPPQGQPQVAHGPPQPGWVQAAGRRHQDRLGRGGDLGGQVPGGVGQRAGMRRGELAGAQGLSRFR